MSEKAPSGWGERWPAPAKLNLMLRVIGRRSDGYHLLQTVFQFIDLADWISFFPRSDRQIRLKNPLPGIAEPDDLTVRAARLLQERSCVRTGMDIELEKILPIGGGLGGGSSDAATALIVLNKLWDLGYATRELMDLGLSLGADVPIFIYGRSAWAEGVGEVLDPIDPPECWYVVLFPECQVSTAEIFASDKLTRDNSPVTIDHFNSGFTCNDCRAVVSQLYPPVKRALDALSGFGDARLTGTGSCVFLACEKHDSASAIAGQLSDRYRVFVVKGCNRSPLHSKVMAFFKETR
ncbi:MAG: 4-(cytidine 5'-diphospho)-2-C-methyl-D-erythritol kinase [Methylococcaceae bacterium]|nr:4-(cytidine 5'-diphospho)-2-C-methyl-D-erythritol kinase [Methylococcaceae bacterium]MCI0668013.1 4-(cytidine 5'-diphospho)-2-C-methyl-D-erythritol kinase [Methylococcaceae bacterium]MCI0733195.1 4-(cytidine 5'-diphospho)-2-C-methyl-D-erythritol kinase [Methylococcaceae bacterium]